MRSVVLGVAALLLGIAACDSPTAPQLFVYADRPVVVPASALGWRSVSVGGSNTCAIRLDGTLYCWGNNSFGQLGVPRPGEHCGDAALECSRRPIAVFGQQRFASVATGIGNHTCGVTLGTALLCWGLGSSGQLGDGYLRDRQILPVGVLAPAA